MGRVIDVYLYLYLHLGAGYITLCHIHKSSQPQFSLFSYNPTQPKSWKRRTRRPGRRSCWRGTRRSSLSAISCSWPPRGRRSTTPSSPPGSNRCCIMHHASCIMHAWVVNSEGIISKHQGSNFKQTSNSRPRDGRGRWRMC